MEKFVGRIGAYAVGSEGLKNRKTVIVGIFQLRACM